MSPARTAAVILGALILQVCLFAQFSYDGARPDVMILLAVLGGYILGPERGAVIGFASGLAFDIVLSTPLGLSALVYTLVGYGAGVATAGVVRSSRWIEPVIAAAGSAVGMVLYAVIGTVIGEATLEGPPLATIVVCVSAVNAVLAPLAARVLRWIRVEDRDGRPAFLAR